jgi:hypothetical protein
MPTYQSLPDLTGYKGKAAKRIAQLAEEHTEKVRERDAQAKGAEQLIKILDTPGSGMSKKYTFDMFGDDRVDDDRPDPAA